MRYVIGVTIGLLAGGIWTMTQANGTAPDAAHKIALMCEVSDMRACEALTVALQEYYPQSEIVPQDDAAGFRVQLNVARMDTTIISGTLSWATADSELQESPEISVTVMDRPQGLPDSAFRDFAQALIKLSDMPAELP